MKSKLENSTTISIKREDLSIEKTVFQILKEGGGNKNKAETYLNWLKKEYPSTAVGIDEVWARKEVQEIFNKWDADWLIFILYFINNEEIIKSIKNKAEEILNNKLFSSNNSDNEIIKDLKTQSIANLIDGFDLCKVDEIAYTIEICKSFYLEWLPKFIEDILKEKQPTLELKDLNDTKWKEIRNKIFTDLYSSWVSTKNLEEINKLQEALGKNIKDLNELVQRTRETVVNDLKTAKENYKTKRPDGQPWALPLTKAEKDKIDEAANKDDLDDVAKKIKEEQDKYELDSANEWIRNNISNKTKPEELITTEQDIDKELGSKKLPPGFKDNVKLTLLAKQINLLPEPTDVLGKIKKHLMDTKYNWRKWEYLIDNEKTDDEDYTVASMYNQTFRKEVAEHVLPKIEVAINTNTIEGYKNLDKEWSGEANIDKKSEVNYNLKRDYFGAWIILRSLLKETTNKKESLDDLKNLAKDALGLSIEDNKTPDQVITVITDEIKKLKQSNDDIKEKFPDLFDKDGKINDDELKKIEDLKNRPTKTNYNILQTSIKKANETIEKQRKIIKELENDINKLNTQASQQSG